MTINVSYIYKYYTSVTRSGLLKTIGKDLKDHAPFTAFGSLIGIAIMGLFEFSNIPHSVSKSLFWILHPFHVLLSALVTAGIYRLHKKSTFTQIFIIGYIGAIGIGTLSDSIIPFMGEWILDLPNRGLHIGFIEKWWLVNPLAIIGVFIAYHWPKTQFPHAGHVLLSTWASLFHMTIALGDSLSMGMGGLIIMFLFLSVWVPCCTSDIVFPLLFVKK